MPTINQLVKKRRGSEKTPPEINESKTKVELDKRNQANTIETNQSNTKPELYTRSKPISINIANQVMKSICKIIIKNKNGINYGTGFFMKISESEKALHLHWYNNGIKEIKTNDPPDGFVKGRLYKK